MFFGASDDVNERAARFFEVWARKNLRAMGAVGGYDAQESIGYVGAAHFTRYSNGAQGWHMGEDKSGHEICVPHYASLPDHFLTERHTGVAVSYVYYPCAE